MKIFIACSRYFYERIPEIKRELENFGHEISLPNSYDNPLTEEEMKKIGGEEHIKWKSSMLRKDKENIELNNAILVLNFEKNGEPDYIGGATFMEIVKAWELNKKIFFYNPIPENIFRDELIAINPTIIHGELSKIQDKKVEVEIRSFISREQYDELLRFFELNSEFVKEDFQETHYFDCEQDLRIQKNNEGSKVWLKTGKIHDDIREEIEIKTNHEDFEKLKKIFSSIGFNTEIKWLRDRNQFNWDGIKVCLDYTQGYGYIIELEKITSESNQKEVLKELREKLKLLNIEETSKEIFNQRYNYYKENWRRLIGDALD